MQYKLSSQQIKHIRYSYLTLFINVTWNFLHAEKKTLVKPFVKDNNSTEKIYYLTTLNLLTMHNNTASSTSTMTTRVITIHIKNICKCLTAMFHINLGHPDYLFCILNVFDGWIPVLSATSAIIQTGLTSSPYHQQLLREGISLVLYRLFDTSIE